MKLAARPHSAQIRLFPMRSLELEVQYKDPALVGVVFPDLLCNTWQRCIGSAFSVYLLQSAQLRVVPNNGGFLLPVWPGFKGGKPGHLMKEWFSFL